MSLRAIVAVSLFSCAEENSSRRAHVFYIFD